MRRNQGNKCFDSLNLYLLEASLELVFVFVVLILVHLISIPRYSKREHHVLREGERKTLIEYFDPEAETMLRKRDFDGLEERKGIKVVDFPVGAPIGILKVGTKAEDRVVCTVEMTSFTFIARGPTGELLVERCKG